MMGIHYFCEKKKCSPCDDHQRQQTTLEIFFWGEGGQLIN